VAEKTSTEPRRQTEADDPRERFGPERVKRVQEQMAERAMAKVIQLPLWPPPKRPAPSAILRSALFGIVRRGRRRHLLEESLAAWKGCELRYTGYRLDQADLDVWLHSLQLFRGRDLRDPHWISARQFLKRIGRKTGKHDYEWLKRSMWRLTDSTVDLELDGWTYTGHLVEAFAWDKDRLQYKLRLNPELADLFADQVTHLDWDSRRQLKMDLAKWLDGYVRSHRATKAAPHRIGIERLRALCGSELARLRRFRELVRKAMGELRSSGAVASWWLKDDQLWFVRPQP